MALDLSLLQKRTMEKWEQPASPSFLCFMEVGGEGILDQWGNSSESRTSGFYSDPITESGSILKAFGCLNSLKELFISDHQLAQMICFHFWNTEVKTEFLLFFFEQKEEGMQQTWVRRRTSIPNPICHFAESSQNFLWLLVSSNFSFPIVRPRW